MVQAHKYPKSLYGSIYNHSMFLEKMLPSVQSKYIEENKDKHWTTTVYQYEDLKSRLVNKLKLLLPLIPGGVDQVLLSVLNDC